MRTLFYLFNFSVNLHLFYYIANYFFKLNEYIRPLLESLLPVFRRSSSAYSNRIGVYGCANLCQSQKGDSGLKPNYHSAFTAYGQVIRCSTAEGHLCVICLKALVCASQCVCVSHGIPNYVKNESTSVRRLLFLLHNSLDINLSEKFSLNIF